ncbi:MAG: hypothetical protein KDC38_09530 [Planctomycetes bacterium]|nr:hypothetical protein [Planctomycetota bacterium]
MLLLLAAIGLPHEGRPQEEPFSKPSTAWFQYYRGKHPVGVLRVEVTSGAGTTTVRDLWSIFDENEEIQIQSETEYSGEALHPVRSSVTVTRGAEPLLVGALRFDDDRVVESYRSGDSADTGAAIERTHRWDGRPFATLSTLAVLAPRWVDRDLWFPAYPRGLRGPVIDDAVTRYRLVRDGDALRVEGKSATALRSVRIRVAEDRVEELDLGSGLRFVRAPRHVCRSWLRTRTPEDDASPVGREEPSTDDDEPTGDRPGG